MKDQSEQPAIDALYRISSIVSTTEDLNKALEIIIDEIMHILPCETAAIEIINPDMNSLEVEAYRGFPKDVTETVLKVGVGVTGWVALHGRPLNIGDVRLDPRYVEVDKQIRSELAVPMRTETGVILGVVNVDSFQTNAFSEQHIKILSLLAAEATRGLSRLWLIQQLRQTADRLEVLIDIARNVVNKRQLDEILGIITSRSKEITPCTLSAIFLREGEEDQLSLRASCGPDGPLDYSETIFLEQSSIGTAFSRRKTVEIVDLPRIEEHHFRDLIREYRLASMLSCPIQFEDEAIGVLNIYTDHPHRFNDGEKRIFETLASLSAATILNARLYQRVFQSEEKLRRSEKLTTLGLLSSEIAHEIRNPLTVIQLLFESLTLDFEADDPRRKDVTIIHEKLEQLETIVSRVLSFGKSRQEMHSRYELTQLIEDTLHLVRLKLRQGKVNLAYTCDDESPLKVDVNKGQIQQALLNLILNAAQALPNGGRIELSATHEELDGQSWAVVRITDNGSGIDPALHDSIFDSFLTGRPDGTGLGLSIVKRILKSHKGSITVENSSPEGTTMRLLLPLAT